MTDDQSLSAFKKKKKMPDAGTPTGWAEGSRRRRRRQRGVVAGLAVVAALVLVVPFALQLTAPAIVANPAESPTPDSRPDPAPAGWAGAAACYEEEGVPVRVDPTVVGEAPPEGAVRAWLCGDATDSASYGTVGPLEPLVTDVDRVVDLIASQPELPADTICTQEYRMSYVIVLEYLDGSTHPVSGELHGCRVIRDGATARGGGEELYELARELWRAQREGQSAGGGVAVLPTCPIPPVMLVPTVDELTGAVVCLPGADQTMREQVELHPDDVALLLSDLRANAVPGQGNGWGASIAFTSPRGDWLALTPTRDEASFSFIDVDDASWLWTPSAESAAILEEATH